MLKAPTFYLTTYLTRGHMEREIEVDVDYTFDGHELIVTKAKDLTEGRELTGEEWACVEDDVARVCDEAFAEWLEDRGEYQRDCRMDARAMGSYVPAQVQA